MTSATDFAKMVPGFDFLQGLVKSAGAGLPGFGQWVAPTLNPQEIDKRIEELRTVQFWLEQNAKMLASTIQALEVQRMTLATLQSMNLPLGELRDALKAPAPPAGAAAAAEPADERPQARTSDDARETAPAGAAAPAVDPMQWWSALTHQFTDLAAKAMRESAGDSARNLAGAVVRQSLDSAGQALGKAAAVPVKAAAATAGAAAGAAKATARRRRG